MMSAVSIAVGEREVVGQGPVVLLARELVLLAVIGVTGVIARGGILAGQVPRGDIGMLVMMRGGGGRRGSIAAREGMKVPGRARIRGRRR